MAQLTKIGQAGTLESNDILVTVAPAAAGIVGIEIELTSPVKKQFGKQIVAVINEVLAERGITAAVVNVNDRGAMDCTIRARVETAVARALVKEDYNGTVA